MDTDMRALLVTCASAVLTRFAPERMAKAPVAAKTDAAPMPRLRGRNAAEATADDMAAGNGRGRIIKAGVVYRWRTGADVKVAHMQNGNNGKVLEVIRKAGRKGVGTRDIEKASKVTYKSVQSSAYQLRKAGLVESVPVNG
jgi:hypothetical protein